jgi:C-terminal processing protease CtpA/Prc
MSKLCGYISAVALTILFCGTSAFADTVILRNGERIKGLILDEYKDRIVVSTVYGEKIIMKSEIRSAIYDSEVKALMQKGKNQVRKMQYIEAHHTYAKALELDPKLQEARERLDYLRSFLETKMKKDIARSVKDKKEKFQGAFGVIPSQRVADEFGITLTPNGKYIEIGKVTDESADALRPGDKIISVWGQLTAYMDTEEVSAALLKSDECKLVIERPLFPTLAANNHNLNNMFSNGSGKAIGAKLKLVKKGIIIKDIAPEGPFGKAGAKEGDILFRINGKNTRYMPMRQIYEIIKENQRQEIEVVIRRSVTLWRKRERI